VKTILASGSPRRRELLESIGLDFEVVVSDVDETYRNGETVAEHVVRLALEKAATVGSIHPDRWIIAADTIVYLDDQILGKPADSAEAVRMLSRIAGLEHIVYTGVALFHGESGFSDSRLCTTSVLMKPMSQEEVAWYVSTGEPLDKAGSYAIQGVGAMFVDSINGNYTNVVGLPLPLLVDMMRDAEIEHLVLDLDRTRDDLR